MKTGRPESLVRVLAGMAACLLLLVGCGGGGGGGKTRTGVPGTTTPPNPSGNNNPPPVTPPTTRPDTTPPARPTGLGAQTTSTGVLFSWTAGTDSDLRGYFVYQETPSLTRISALLSQNRMPHVLSSIPGEYRFSVSAVDQAGNESQRSEPITLTVLAPSDTTPPPTPQGLNLNYSQGTGGYFLSWQAVSAADLEGYVVYQRLNGGEVTALSGVLSAASYNLGELLPGSYQFFVSAQDETGNESSRSLPLNRVIDPVITPSLDTTAPPSPTGLRLSQGTQGLLLEWDSLSTADLAGYRIWRSTGGGLPQPISGVLGPTSFLIGNLTQVGTYAFYVSALDTSSNESQRSTPVSWTVNPPPPDVVTPPPVTDLVPPPVPTGLSGSAGNTTASLTWQAVTASDLAGYLVYQTSSVLEDPIKVTPSPISGSSLTVSGLVNQQTVFFSVSSVDIHGNESDQTAGIPLTPTAPDTTAPSSPSGLGALALDGGVRLFWTNPTDSDAKEVLIYWREVTGGQALGLLRVEALPTATVDVMALQNGSTYAFAISSRDIAGNESTKSGEVQATPTQPPVLDVTAPQIPGGLTGTAGNGKVDLSWMASPDPDVAGYRVFSTTGPDFSNIGLITEHTSGGGILQTSLEITGLGNGVERRFAVKAVDLSGNESDYSLALALTPRSTETSSWPGFLNGGQHQAHGTFSGNPSYTFAWEENINNDIVSAPVIATRSVAPEDPAYQVLFFGGNDQIIRARSLKTGAQLWQASVGHYVGATPLYIPQSDGLLVAAYSGRISFFDAATGAERWRKSVANTIVSSPVSDGTVAYFGSWNGKVYAYRLSDGVQLWVHNTGGQVWSSPALSEDGQTLYIGTTTSNPGGDLRALHTSNGTQKWSFFVGAKVLSSPVLADGKIYFGAYTQRLYVVKESDGTLVSSFLANGAIDSSPLVTEDSIYFGTGSYPLGTAGHTLYALNKSDLSVRWTDEKTRFDVDQDLLIEGIVEASPIQVGADVCVGSWDYTFACHRASTGAIMFELVTGKEVHAPAAQAGGYMAFASRDGVLRVYKVE